MKRLLVMEVQSYLADSDNELLLPGRSFASLIS